MEQFFVRAALSLGETFRAAAPYVLFGFLAAGALSVLFSPARLAAFLGRPGLGSVTRAALAGIPLPLCSCGVIPAAVALRKRGASRGATVSFLVSTPETGVDSIALSFSLLNPLLTVARPLVALVTAVTAGLFTDLLTTRDPAEPPRETGCFVCDHPGEGHAHSVSQRVRRGLRFALVDLADDIAFWLLLGLLLAALVAAAVPAGFFGEMVGNSLGVKVAVLAAAIPLYVCATFSTPVAASLMAVGMSPGTALVFLLAGPATNTVTILAVRSALGGRALAVYLGSIAGVTLLAGEALDFAAGRWNFGAWASPPGEVAACCLPSWIEWGAAALLAAVLGAALFRRAHARLAPPRPPGRAGEGHGAENAAGDGGAAACCSTPGCASHAAPAAIDAEAGRGPHQRI
ncbi:MAG: SO_0444 family Cu/Zn efflux transporter [Planctomycetes bacterium]|nr:SO_0444 family Cu/Zn efflux transporter [Planctomycetota bacterium]